MPEIELVLETFNFENDSQFSDFMKMSEYYQENFISDFIKLEINE